MNPLRTFVICLLALVNAAAFAAEDPAVKLSKTVNAALDVLYGDCCLDHSDEDKEAKVRDVLRDSYDLEVIIRFAAGLNWKRFKPDEQKRFMDLIEQLVLKTYVKGLNGKERPDIVFGKTKNSGKRAEVPSVVTLDGKPIKALYRFAMRESGWEIYDIVVEDISVGKNYREQFNEHFRRGSVAELIEKLEKLLEEDNLDEKITL